MSASPLCTYLVLLISFFKTHLYLGVDVTWTWDVVPPVPSPSQFSERPGVDPRLLCREAFLISSNFLFPWHCWKHTRSKSKTNLTLETGNGNGPTPLQTTAQPVRVAHLLGERDICVSQCCGAWDVKTDLSSSSDLRASVSHTTVSMAGFIEGTPVSAERTLPDGILDFCHTW